MLHFSYLIATVVDEDFKDRRFLPTCFQWRQVIEGGVHWTVSPVLKLTWKMTNFLIFDLTPYDVLENLKEKNEGIFLFNFQLG